MLGIGRITDVFDRARDVFGELPDPHYWAELLKGNRYRNWQAPSIDVLVLDASPSMEQDDYKPTRLEGAMKAALHFLDTLVKTNPNGLVSVVEFNQKARTLIKPVPVQSEFEKLVTAVQSVTTDSYTNIGAGLARARTEITRFPDVNHPRIVLLTDGESNTGPDPASVAGRIKRMGIQLDIIGIGGSPKEVNEPLLKKMASVVNGERRYWFIENVGELVRRFEALALREIK